ncbi:hypothetical protein GGR57DRAFT_472637 [Xylariaceae sp. FL1272]|nr:hypothetical protein GGR57DRAFT_472637 [Xylariaceae sp. FL1272]
MAVGDEASLWPTDNLLLKHARKHYRTQVSPIHWQLRSLISAEGNGNIYYPAGLNNTHITRLDTNTRECETIKVISFYPRCLVASGGWICCGGENGEFAIIRESGRPELSDNTPTADRGATPSVPEASMSELHRDILNIVERLNGSAKTWSATNHKFGSQRVNCITIWQPAKSHPVTSPRPEAYPFPVAILANNDKSVTVVSLHDAEAVDELEYPDCVNRGVISPDGRLLVAICDDPFLYVHVRVMPPKTKRGSCAEWIQLPKIRLKDQSPRDTSDCRGSFAACFSPSGRYLAVGTQYGTISIFDTATMIRNAGDDPLITYWSSARAPIDVGAVRDMAFSPGPYDVLAWAEHRGCIGVADARTNFTRRQIISIEDHTTFDHVPLNERNTIDPRLLDPRNEQNAGTAPSMASLGNQTSRNQPSSETTDTSRLNQPYSAQETAILEAMQSERRRREAREQREQREQRERGEPQGPRNTNAAAWRSSVFAERVSPQQRTPGRERDRDISERLRYLTSLQRDTLTRILERERQRENRDHQRSVTTQTTQTTQTHTPAEQDRERRVPTPRRRNSLMAALTQNVDNLTQQTINRLQGFGSGEGGNSSRDSSSVWTSGNRAASGWADLEALYNMTTGENGNPSGIHDTTRSEVNRIRRAIPVISDVWNDDTSGFRRAYGRNNNIRDHQQNPDDTAGLT